MSRSVVCLDAGNTLFVERAGRARLYADVFAELGVSVDEASMASWMGAVHDELPEPRYTDDWFRAFVGRLLRRAGSDRDPEPVRARLADLFTRPESYLVHGDVFPCLDDLTERGLRLAIVSNWSDRLTGLLAALGLLRYFEVVSISAVVGRGKPDPAIFEHALQRLGVSPDQALHVGDHPLNDLAAARNAGLAALLIDREGAAGADPHDAIRSLEELPERVARL